MQRRHPAARTPSGTWLGLRRVLWLCAALLSGPALAQDDPPGRVGRVATLAGDVWVYEAEPGDWVAALRNRPVTSGDRLSTAPGAAASLQIGSTTLFLGGSSELTVLQLDDDAMRFRLEQGSLALRVRSSEVASELMVANFEGHFVPLTAGLYRIDRGDERSEATVWRGALQYQSPDMTVELQAGQRARFWQEGQPLATRSIWLAPLDDGFAQAVQREDRADSGSAVAQFVAPEMTGGEDLDRLGRWQQHPEYGAVWSPTVVRVGWVPYRYGQWVWLRPWGWTWVDDAPWGFAPFHYGRWFWWGSRWCWAPGPVVRRPAFAPALVAWTGGPTLGSGVGSPPMVGWVPLAPREIYRPAYGASLGYVNRLNPGAPWRQAPPPGQGNRAVPGAVTLLPTPALRPHQPVAAAALGAGGLPSPLPAGRPEQFHHQAPAQPTWPARDSISPRPVPPIGAAPVPGIDRGGPPHLRQAPEVPGTVAAPLPGPTTGPFFGRPQAPPQRGALPPAGPRTPGLAGMPGSSSTDAPAVPQPAVRPRRPPELPDGALPRMPSPAVGMTPPTSAAVPPRAPPRPVAPAVPDASLPPAAPVAPAAPVVQTAPAVPGAQRAAPQPTRPGAPVADKAAVPAPRVESVEAKRGRDDADAGQRRRTPASRQKQFER